MAANHYLALGLVNQNAAIVKTPPRPDSYMGMVKSA